jgi:hypothetical protein
LLDAPAVLQLELVLQPSQRFEAIGRAALGDGDGRVVVVGDEPAQIAEPLGDDVEHRPIGRQRHVLDEARDAHAWSGPNAPGVRRQLAAEDLQQRRLSRAVAPEDGDALPRLDLKRCVVEQWKVAERVADFVERE